MVQAICEHCGEEYGTYPSHLKAGRRYCKQACATAARRVTCVCEQCGKTFETRKCEARPFCNPACRGKAARRQVCIECAHCAEAFEVSAAEAKRGRKYCDETCMAQAFAGQVDRVCEYCGDEFKTWPYKVRAGRGRFCKKACWYASKRGVQGERVRVDLNCVWCGRSFRVVPSRAKTAKYCKRPCADAAKQGMPRPDLMKRVSRLCAYCGKGIAPVASLVAKGFGLYCNHRCAGRARRRSIASYNGYVSVRVGEDWYLEHRLTMEQMLGRTLEPEEVVHHINGDRSDNRPKNLRLFGINGEHIQFHGAQQAFVRTLHAIVAQRGG